jgi:hypothetical protein
MKRTLTSVAAAAMLCSFTLLPGDCDKLVFFKEGTSATMTSYNDDGKVTGSTKTMYTKVSKNATGTSVTASQENFDKKGKSASKGEYTLKCENGTLVIDMRSMIPASQAESYKDMEVTMEGSNLEYPNELVVGSSLKDADVKFSAKTKEGMPMPMMNMSMKITNRKVEAKESVTTPAGTFECYKLSELVESKTIFSMKVKSVSWFSWEAGTVKTESYKENGKLMGKTELTELKK